MPMRQYLLGGLLAAALLIVPDGARAGAALDGTALRWPWALPFIGILLTIAAGPLVFPKLWHRHYGKLASPGRRSRSRHWPRSMARRQPSPPSCTPCWRSI